MNPSSNNIVSINDHVALKYTSQEYKYSQYTFIPHTEVCSLSQYSVRDLYTKNVEAGYPHILALVHDLSKGQNIYNAGHLGRVLASGKRWEWLNPCTRTKIEKIDYFIMNKINACYQLIKTVKVDTVGDGQTYEDLWFCNNLALASDYENPHAFHSLTAVRHHYNVTKEAGEETRWAYFLLKSIERHYGKGIAILLTPYIMRAPEGQFLNNLLFDTFNYTSFDSLFEGSNIYKFISEKGESLFKKEELTNNYKTLQELFQQVIEEKKTHPAAKFSSYLFSSLDKGSFSLNDLQSFDNDPCSDLSHIAQAALCFFHEPYIEKYINSLNRFHPDWALGRVYVIDKKKLETDNINILFADLIELSKKVDDIRVLGIIAHLYDKHGVSMNGENVTSYICMQVLNASRKDRKIASLFAEQIQGTEPGNNLAILQQNFDLFSSWNDLLNLSDAQRVFGMKNKQEEIYKNGVSKGLNVFFNRDKHGLIPVSLGKDLIKEITPFNSSKEWEELGINILKEALSQVPNHPLARLSLADYLIRKGTSEEAIEAHRWVKDLEPKFPKEPKVHCYSIRFLLRSAQKQEDLLKIETMLAEVKGLKHENDASLLSLLNALWLSHPLRRNMQPEWYFLAAAFFKKAFENSDSKHVQFLLGNLARYDNLTEDDQMKCRMKIAELLGYPVDSHILVTPSQPVRTSQESYESKQGDNGRI